MKLSLIARDARMIELLQQDPLLACWEKSWRIHVKREALRAKYCPR